MSGSTTVLAPPCATRAPSTGSCGTTPTSRSHGGRLPLRAIRSMSSKMNRFCSPCAPTTASCSGKHEIRRMGTKRRSSPVVSSSRSTTSRTSFALGASRRWRRCSGRSPARLPGQGHPRRPIHSRWRPRFHGSRLEFKFLRQWMSGPMDSCMSFTPRPTTPIPRSRSWTQEPVGRSNPGGSMGAALGSSTLRLATETGLAGASP